MQVFKKFHEIQEYLLDEPLGKALLLHWFGVANHAQGSGTVQFTDAAVGQACSST